MLRALAGLSLLVCFAGCGDGGSDGGGAAGTGGDTRGELDLPVVLSARARWANCIGSFLSGDESTDLVFKWMYHRNLIECLNAADDCAGVLECASVCFGRDWAGCRDSAGPQTGVCTGIDAHCDGTQAVACSDGEILVTDCGIVPGGACARYDAVGGAIVACVPEGMPCDSSMEGCNGSVATVCDDDFSLEYDCADVFGATCLEAEGSKIRCTLPDTGQCADLADCCQQLAEGDGSKLGCDSVSGSGDGLLCDRGLTEYCN